jgi:DNA segregation ATPase FtsK/SpoIIIE-like protein
MYVLDLAGRNFRGLEDFPHVGGVIYADDETFEERMQRLLERLTDLVEERQARFGDAKVTGFYEYNQQAKPDEILPAILVVMDNIAILHENYQNLVENTIIPLVRRSAASGVTFAVSSNSPTGLHRLGPLLGTWITLRQNKPEVYLDIVGRGAVELADIPGRGYIRQERRPLEFQTALPVGVFDQPGGDSRREGEELGLMAAAMSTVWNARPRPAALAPVSIDVLETRTLTSLLREAPPPRSTRIQAVLGVDNDLKPALIDLMRQSPHFSITGPARSGRTTVLYNWALSLAERYPPDRVALLLIDLQRKFVGYGGHRRLNDLPHVKAVAFDLDELEQMTAKLTSMVKQLATPDDQAREIFVLIDNFDDAVAEMENSAVARDLGLLVRRNAHLGLHVVVVGGRGASAFELQRRIRSAGFGVGLRTAEAVSALDASRTPAGLRTGAELAVGRGYVVRSGQTMLIQMANPYEDVGTPSRNGVVKSGNDAAEDGDGNEAAVQALDAWIERIRAKYGGYPPGWDALAEEGAPTTTVAVPLNPRLVELGDLVRQLARWELGQLKSTPSLEPLVSLAVAQFLPESWSDEPKLRHLVGEGLIQMDGGNRWSEVWDDTSKILTVQQRLAQAAKAEEAQANGVAN